jgi:tetratricopeptide (TPR) repeat protein
VGQPGHRAWVGVYNNPDNAEQYQTNIGYQVGSRESATAHSELIYNQYTKVIRETGMERFTGVATGVSPASGGEHTYNQSMIFQHIGKLLEEDGESAEAILKKSIELAPQNVDAWYQLALYYASLDRPEKVIALAKEFMSKRNSFFLDVDSRKGANNMEVVTAKNIAFIALKAPSIDGGRGDRAEWGKEELWAYLDQYETQNRSLRSYRNQNRYLAKLYLQKEKNEEGFVSDVVSLFEQFLEKGSSGSYYSDYFRGVEFGESNKTELFDQLQRLTDQAQIAEGRRNEIYKDILGRTRSLSLANITVYDVCLDRNLSICQSLKLFEVVA